MDLKINSYIKFYKGPSPNYYNACNRFESILENKLGMIKELKYYNNDTSLELDDKINNENIQNSKIDNPIFSSSLNNLTKSEFSKSKPLNKNIGSLILDRIVDSTDVRKKSNITPSQINNKLKGTPLEGLGEDFKRAEDLYGVNSIVLMAMAKLESNYGRSKIAQDKNNIFGFQAYDSSPYASAKKYSSKKDSIYDVAKHLSENYLSEDGDYFRGYSIEDIGKNYCSKSDWAPQIKQIVSEIVLK